MSFKEMAGFWFLLSNIIVVSAHFKQGVQLHSRALSTAAANNELGAILDDLVELERESNVLKSQIKLLPAPTSRHNALQNTFFNAVGRTNTDQCGKKVINEWTSTVQRFADVAGTDFNAATGVYTAPESGYYFISACFRCRQGNACDVQMRYQGALVASMKRRDDTGNSWGQMCNQVIQLMALGATFDTFEEAGGGNPPNCKFNGAVPYSTFNGFRIIEEN